MKILLHICCAPCALMPFEELTGEGHEIMGLFYNPNVQPYTENQKRKETLVAWAEQAGLKLTVHDEYDPESWLRNVAFREANRCQICYHGRLTRAAQVARKGGFDAFTTTLLYSIRQKHDLLAEAGRAVAAERGVPFLYRDFRPRWKQGVELSLQKGLYRQPYCGCIFSERDRYLGSPRAQKRRAESIGGRKMP
jgi:Uncharacterized protein conserved in bacteria